MKFPIAWTNLHSVLEEELLDFTFLSIHCSWFPGPWLGSCLRTHLCRAEGAASHLQINPDFTSLCVGVADGDRKTMFWDLDRDKITLVHRSECNNCSYFCVFPNICPSANILFSGCSLHHIMPFETNNMCFKINKLKFPIRMYLL